MSSWSSRSLGRNWQHQFFYLAIRLGGRRLAYFVLNFIVAWYVLFSREARRRCRFYLERRFPQAGRRQRLVQSYRLLQSFGQVLIDRATVGICGADQFRVTLRGKEDLLALLARNRGLILINAHVGCWQVAMSALGFMETPVNLLMQREEGDIDRHYFDHAGIECPYHIIDPRGFLGGALEMMAVLKRGEVLSVMGDRMLGDDRNGVPVDFLGGRVLVPYSAYKLAAATGAPVVALFSYKTGPASYQLELFRTITAPVSTGRDAQAFVPCAQEFADSLAAFCQRHPFQFFNFFNMWYE